MFSFARDLLALLEGTGRPTPFIGFFAFVWLLWTAKAVVARRYRPFTGAPAGLRTSVVVPVYDEPEDVWRRALASVVANAPSELIAVVDGGDAGIARIASEYCDRVLRIPK